VAINADWGLGLYAPLTAKLKRELNGTQTFSLIGKTSDTTDVTLFQQSDLSDDFVRCRLTILPEHDLVNVQINDVDLGTFQYSTYTATSTDRFLSVSGDTTNAEFDYVEVRVSETN
jgi:hypothetical protein